MVKRYQLLLISFLLLSGVFAQTPVASSVHRPALRAVPMEMPQTDTTILWVQLMQSPQPNYFAVKRAFEAHFGGVVPDKGQGYKVFKRWEARVIDHLDAGGNVVWPNGVLAELSASNTSSGSGSGSSGSGSSGTGSSGGSGTGSSGSGTSGGSSGSGSSSSPTGGTNLTGLNAGNPVTPATWCATSGRWSPVGPTKHPYNQTSQPTGTGRINGIAFHPTDTNTFFALAPQGGVWKTKDYGKSWKQLWGAGNGLSVGSSAPSNPALTLGVSSMVLSHKNPDTLYIGTGDRDAGDAPGYGILMSTNGGTSFVVRNSGMGNLTVGKLIMHPKNTAILLAATNGGVYRTTNSGGTWTRVSVSANFMDIVYHPGNPNYVYATANGLFYRSTDAGLTFAQITNGVPASGMQRGQIAVTAADRGRVYFLIASGSRFQGFYMSTDSGTTFVNRSTTPANILGYSELGNDGSGQGWYDLDLAADPRNAQVVYAFGINVWKSTDGGATFKVSGHWVGSGSADDIHADQHSGEFNITGRTLFAGNDGGVYFTGDGGKIWNNITNGINNSQIYRLAVAQTTDDLGAHGYQDNGSMQHHDGEIYTYYGGDGMDCAVDPTDERYVYGSYVFGRIYRAIEKNNLTTIGANGTNGITEGGGWLTPFVLQEGNPNRMFAGYNNLWRCDSVKSVGTIKWTRISTGWTGSVRQIKSSKSNPRHLYVIRGDGKLMFTRDAEATVPVWVDVTPPSTLFSLRIMEPDPLDSTKLYGASATDLFVSNNNGTAWNSSALASLNKTAYPGFNWGVINVLKADHTASPAGLYVGTDRAVYYMNQVSGSTYGLNEFANQLPLWMDVSDLDIYHSPLGRDYSFVYASTYGRGVWKSPLFDDGSGTYRAKMLSYDSIFTVGGVMRLQEKIPASVYGIRSTTWSIKPSNFSWVSGDSNSLQPEVKFNQPGVYSISLAAKSCTSNATETKSLWVRVFPAAVSATCNSKTRFQTSNFGIGVFDVKLTDNHFESGTYFDDGELLDMSAQKVFRVKPNTDYTVQVKVGLYNSENVRVFMDFNKDGKFQAFKGEVSAQTSAKPSEYAQVKIKTPAKMQLNQALRMRVISDYNNIDTTGCGTCNYGQAEDFSLVFEKTTVAFGVDRKKICAGESVVFTDSSQGLIGLYEWDFGVGAVPSKAVGTGPWTVKYSSGGFKNVKLRLNAGEDSLVKMALVDVVKMPSAQALVKTGHTPQCEGVALVLAARDAGALSVNYQWFKGGNPATPLIKDSLLNFNPVYLKDTGDYWAILENRGCFDTTAIVKVDVWAKPVAAIGYDAAYVPCLKGNSFVFQDLSTVFNGSISSRSWTALNPSKTGTSATFQQQFSLAGSHAVQLRVGSINGCLDTETVVVKVNGHPLAKFALDKPLQCDKGNVFQVVNTSSNPVASGGGAVWSYYNWSDGNAGWDALDAKHNYGQYGKYNVQLVVKNSVGCFDTTYQMATVFLTPKSQITGSASEVCEGQSFTINDAYLNHADPNDGVIVAWNFGDGRKLNRGLALKSGKCDTLWSYPGFGKYSIKQVLKTKVLGCADSSSFTIDVNSIPLAAIRASATVVCAEMLPVNFTSQSTNADGKPMSYDWQFGDGMGVSALASPTYLYNNPGNYKARCIVVNKGCKDTAYTQSIKVLPKVKADFSYGEFALQQRLGWRFAALDTLNVPVDRDFRWKFENPDATVSQGQGNVWQQYFTTNGNYKVKLIATNSIGCRDSSIQLIDVSEAVLRSQQNELNAYVFPNPTTDRAVYKFSARKGDVVTVKMYTILGQSGLYERTWNIPEDGVYFDEIAMRKWDLSAGMYPLVIQRGDQRVEVMMILME